MSIRRKLFLAFIAAAALPLVTTTILARLYVERERADLDQRFVDDARLAFHRIDSVACERVAYWHETMGSFVSSLVMSFMPVPVAEPASPDDFEIMAPVWSMEEQRAEMRNAAKARETARAKEESKFQSSMVSSLVSGLHHDHPAIVGIKIQLMGRTMFSDLPDDVTRRDLGEALESDGRDTHLFRDPRGRYFFFAQLDVNDATSGAFMQVDPWTLLSIETPFHGGAVLYVEQNGNARAAENGAHSTLPLTSLAAQLPLAGKLGSARAVSGGPWRIYAATAGENVRFGLGDGATLIATAPENQLYAPVARFQLEVLGAMLLSLLVALGLSYWLSGRFTESVENLKRGVDALSRGELMQLEKSSADELGGELVDHMNRMAAALAERTRREEIEGWRRLVRVLSHEINNTLGPVKSVATTVRDQIAKRVQSEAGAETAEDLRTAFRLIVDRVDSLSSFISGYAVLAKLPPPECAPADLNEVVRGAVSMMRELAGTRQLIIDEHYGASLPSSFDRQQLERVAINLIKNAVEAAAARVVVKTERRGGLHELTVEDDGAGIATEARAHLFVPYYTTKPGGSGIGLALARQIVLGHGGTIGAEARLGGGTILRVVLPAGALI